jgi:hypothetical protein
VVERLGPDDGEVAFRGTFSGPDAEARVRAFDTLRTSGDVVWLTWETFRRQVVVKSFVADYESPWWIRYDARCVVVHQSGVSSALLSTMSALVTSDLGNALSAATESGLSLIPLQSALALPNALTTGTSDQVEAMAAVGTTLDCINSQIAAQSAQLTRPTAADLDPGAFIQTVTTITSSAGLLASAVNAGSYVGRIGMTLTRSGT